MSGCVHSTFARFESAQHELAAVKASASFVLIATTIFTSGSKGLMNV
jgi:hypothetical protein